MLCCCCCGQILCTIQWCHSSGYCLAVRRDLKQYHNPQKGLHHNLLANEAPATHIYVQEPPACLPDCWACRRGGLHSLQPSSGSYGGKHLTRLRFIMPHTADRLTLTASLGRQRRCSVAWRTPDWRLLLGFETLALLLPPLGKGRPPARPVRQGLPAEASRRQPPQQAQVPLWTRQAANSTCAFGPKSLTQRQI